MNIAKLKSQVNTALQKLVCLMESWGLDPKDYVLVDEFAYVLNDYPVFANEIEEKHLDLYVSSETFPWKDKGERSIIPPFNSTYFDQYESFMKNTGFSLDLLSAKPGVLKIPSVEYKLSNERFIRVMKPFEMTEAFVQQTLMHYSLTDVGREKIVEWLNKLDIIKEAAEKKGDKKLSELCRAKLVECKAKWRGII